MSRPDDDKDRPVHPLATSRRERLALAVLLWVLLALAVCALALA